MWSASAGVNGPVCEDAEDMAEEAYVSAGEIRLDAIVSAGEVMHGPSLRAGMLSAWRRGPPTTPWSVEMWNIFW